MGKIKFRAWDKMENKMCFVIGFDLIEEKVVLSYNKPFTEDHEVYERDFEDIELMQYIKLKDKKSRQIYEGDIVDDNMNVGIVYYDKNKLQYRVKYSKGHTGELTLTNGITNVYVVGNKFKNKGLFNI